MLSKKTKYKSNYIKQRHENFQKVKYRKKQKIECLPIAPAIKCDQCPLRLGLAISNHVLVDSITPKYVAPVARDPVTPGLIPL